MTTLVEELESAAFVLDEAIGTAAYGHKGAAIVGSVLAARLRARAARVRELTERHVSDSDTYAEGWDDALHNLTGTDLGPTGAD